MATGKAAVLVEPNRIETWDVPVVDPEPGGLLVSMVVGGVCGSDHHIASGELGALPFPIILGHEGVGRIEKLGAGVTADYASTPVKEGDLVYWAPIALCGHCYSCAVLQATPCENTSFFEHAEKPNWGCHQEYTWLPARTAFFKLPDGADPYALAALGCALPTALMAFGKVRPVKYQDAVVIQGAGPVGLAASMLASVAGAREVVVIDASEKRLESARSLGATATVTLAGTAEERRAQIYDIVGPRGPEIVVEATGYFDAFPEGVDLTGNHGTYSMVGLWAGADTRLINPTVLVGKNMGAVGASFPAMRHYFQAVGLAARLQDRLPLADLITHRFGIAEEAAALEAVASGAAIKAIIEPTR
jgi:5-exo-hydroxycamphor dehydrogenase